MRRSEPNDALACLGLQANVPAPRGDPTGRAGEEKAGATTWATATVSTVCAGVHRRPQVSANVSPGRTRVGWSFRFETYSREVHCNVRDCYHMQTRLRCEQTRLNPVQEE